MSPESIEKRLVLMRGKPRPPEVIERIKEGNRRYWEGKTRPAAWNKGKKLHYEVWNKGNVKRPPNPLADDDEAYGNFKKYRNRVTYRTRVTYTLHKEEINPLDLLLGKCGVDGAHQIDHKMSVREGFENRIPVEVIAGKDNLQILPWLDNVKKYDGTRKNR